MARQPDASATRVASTSTANFIVCAVEVHMYVEGICDLDVISKVHMSDGCLELTCTLIEQSEVM
jgi:hypothetical protein